MVRYFRLKIVIFVYLVSLAGFGWAAETINRDTYDRYIAAYQAYQDAVGKKLPAEELLAKLQDYISAKATYDKEIGKNPAEQPIDEAITDQSLSSAPQDAVKTTIASGGYFATGTFQLGALSPELKAILSELWTEKGMKSPDSAIKKLEEFIKARPNSFDAARAQYELAKAYEWLKKDNVKAEKVLKALCANPRAGFLKTVAEGRLKYLQATTQHLNWKETLRAKTWDMENQYRNYRNTSWLAFPVKISRFFGYVGKIFTNDNAQEDYKKFQLWYEEMGSRFTPPPEVVFDLFKVPQSNGDQEGTVKLEYSNNGSWYARWKLLNDAKKSIDVQYFIVTGDIFGNSLHGLLLRKAKEGLKIRYMVDARGTKGFTRKLMGQDYLQELAEFPNVEIKIFNPIHENLITSIVDLRKVMASDHDKIIVVDEEYSIIGGRNISKDYFVESEDHPTAYRDCDVVIKSNEVARALSLAFDEEFVMLKQLDVSKDLWGNVDIMSREMEAAYQAMDIYIRGGKFFNPAKPDKRTAKSLKVYNEELAQYKHMVGFSGFDPMNGSHETPVKIIDKHSLAGFRNDITDQLVRFIDGAKFEIIIQNPYVVITERADAALKRAAKRGVRIIMQTNSPINTDSLATQAMFYSDWKRILKEIPTLEIYVLYRKMKLHAKTFIFDRKVSIVGTYNMDYMSEEINSEVVAAIKSKEFCAEHRGYVFKDLSDCKQYKIEVNDKGEAKSVFGPDDLKNSKFWLIKALSKLKFLKTII